MKNKLIIIGGPTGVGKTELSIKLAKEINGEIISADSVQVYKYLDIGSAKITAEEMEGITHYGIDCLQPAEEFNVVYFKNMAEKAMQEIYSKGKIPIITGGTGFYIQAVLYDITFEDSEKNDSYRNELLAVSSEKGNEYLHSMLAKVDEKAAEAIHPNNVKRVIRALEYYHETGRQISLDNERESLKKSPYDYRYFAITDDREALYRRIDKRVDKMIDAGLEQEIISLQKMGLTRDNLCMQGIGYKEMLDYLDGLITKEEAIEAIKQGSRRYAKRQLTWLRREKEVIWLDRNKYKTTDDLLKEALLHL